MTDARTLLAGASLLMAIIPAAASAQSSGDVVVMRRQVAPPNRTVSPAPTPTPGTPTPTPAPDAGPYGWVVTALGPWDSTCSSNATRTQTSECHSAAGTRVDDSRCDPEDRPGAAETQVRTEGCSYYWAPDDWGQWSSTCSKTATRTRSAKCMRTDGVDHAKDEVAYVDKCAGQDVTLSDGPSEITTSCTYVGTYSSTYGACVNGQQTAPLVSCARSDNTPADLSRCAPQSAPKACGKCTDWIKNSAPGGYTQRFTLGYTTNAADALAMCNARAEQLGRSGLCTWNSYTGGPLAGWPATEVNFVIGGQGYTGLWSGYTADSLHLSTCTE